MKFLREINDEALIVACEAFLANEKTPAIKDAVNDKLKQLGVSYTVSREQVYALLDLARERRYFLLCPPEHMALKARLADYFHHPEERIHVSNSQALQHVAATAADLLVDLIREVGEKNNNHVHLGLGGGWTTRLVANQLATRLRGAENIPELTLHALTSGFDPTRPDTAPVTFFGFFEGIATKINYVGLFAQPFVKTVLYNDIINEVGVKESFDLRDEINLVVTSLGSEKHEHGDFNRFMSRGKKKDRGILKKAGWVGDVQYRAFSESGPIEKETEIKAVTLLDLDRLAKIAAHEKKHVVVVAGPCRDCTKTRANAARPLLESKALEVWSHIVFDLKTAGELLDGP